MAKRLWWCADMGNAYTTVDWDVFKEDCYEEHPCTDRCGWVLVVPASRVERRGWVHCEGAEDFFDGMWDEEIGRWTHTWPDSGKQCGYRGGHCEVWLVEGDPDE